jgi:O-acetylhomoserine (thiol)-lyase
MALFPLMGPGKNIVASTRLYGGTITQFSQTIKRFGWSAKFVDTDDLGAVARPSTTTPARSFAKRSPTPAAMSPTFRRWPRSPMQAGIPLIVDNTTGHALAVQARSRWGRRWSSIQPPNT